jgi:CheY-like chemotaxis protein
MRMTFRTKLLAIVGTAALAFVALTAVSAVMADRVDRQLVTIEQSYVPKVELGPQLEALFDQLRRAFQDAVAARDGDALEATRDLRNVLLDRVVSARDLLAHEEAGALRNAIEDYYTSGYDISRRMILGEAGEELVNAMSVMQARQTRALDMLRQATAIDKGELRELFSTARRAQVTAQRVRLGVAAACLLFVGLLTYAFSRAALRALEELRSGFARFGKGEFTQPIRVAAGDEIADIAAHANTMARNLQQGREERDAADWLKAGLAGLARELRGELEPHEVGSRAVRFLARYVEAPAGALYYDAEDGRLSLIGEYAHLRPGDGEDTPRSFRRGEGLVGQAALHEEICVVTDPPRDYLRIGSGLGEGVPRALVFLPLVHVGKVTGVLELGLFKPCSASLSELLLVVRETLAIAIEVARARSAMRDLLAETQRQAERLIKQEEQLHATNEELSAQQEELRQTNEELTQQAQELDAQRKTLQQKNTELDEAGQRLAQKADELTKVSTYKSQFLANMSHELRTPLNSMLLLSSLLADNEARNLSEKQVEFCRTIYGAGKDLLALINQVLDLAKVESGKQQVRVEAVEVSRLVDYVERTFRPLAVEKQLAFTVERGEALPGELKTDLQRVQQILNNLIGNAIKFTLRGEVKLSVRRAPPDVEFRRSDLRHERTLAFEVSDTGVGIASEHLERVFAPFEQVEAASDRRFGGTGLGLTISRELAHLLGGEIQLVSVAGKGSTFTCYLPYELERATEHALEPAGAAATPAAPPREPSPPSNGATNDAYLLVIEDDPRFADAVREIVRQQNLRCEIVSDGQSGLALALARPPSGVILDVKLPGVDGWQIMARLRADPRTAKVPVHFVSGGDDAVRALAMGAVGYLPKPASRQDLARVIDALAPRARESLPILVVEEDAGRGDSLVRELAAERLEVRRVASAEAALAAARSERFACLILDLSLPEMDGLELLHSLREQCGEATPPIVVYTERPLSKTETKRIEAYAETVVLKQGSSSERLLDEVRLFVRRLKGGLSTRRQGSGTTQLLNVHLDGKKVLVVDDDMRTVYALSATLRAKGAEVLVADTGAAALDVLGGSAHVDAVLMDIMMPEMDGYETMRRIRNDMRLTELPIIALTAKAMKGDREKCLEVGASDYLPKPIDPERLLAMLHSQLFGDVAARPEGLRPGVIHGA